MLHDRSTEMVLVAIGAMDSLRQSRAAQRFGLHLREDTANAIAASVIRKAAMTAPQRDYDLLKAKWLERIVPLIDSDAPQGMMQALDGLSCHVLLMPAVTTMMNRADTLAQNDRIRDCDNILLQLARRLKRNSGEDSDHSVILNGVGMAFQAINLEYGMTSGTYAPVLPAVITALQPEYGIQREAGRLSDEILETSFANRDWPVAFELATKLKHIRDTPKAYYKWLDVFLAYCDADPDGARQAVNALDPLKVHICDAVLRRGGREPPDHSA